MKKLTTLFAMLLIAVSIFAQEDDEKKKDRRWRNQGTHHSMNFDLGINNILEDGKSPQENNELYTVKSFGSWNFAINSVNTTHIGGAFHLQWGGSLSWYNFKFENAATRIVKMDDKVTFELDQRTDINPIKSKLTASYLNVSLVPMLDFSTINKRDKWGWHRKNDGFRIGVGGYAGYKISSHSKAVYEINNVKKKDKNRDSYFLNTWRYGARLQVGFRDVDIFVNYDLNELFSENRGPKLNAFSFGIII